MSKDNAMLDVVRKLIYGVGAAAAVDAGSAAAAAATDVDADSAAAAAAAAVDADSAVGGGGGGGGTGGGVAATDAATGAQHPQQHPKQPLEFFQSTALLKPPRVGREKPWHQDHAYFDVDTIPSPSVRICACV